MTDTPGLLGSEPRREFKVLRTEHPAIFRFNGKLYMEEYNIDEDEHLWFEISEPYALNWLREKSKS